MKNLKQVYHLFKPYLVKKRKIVSFIFILITIEAISGRMTPLLFGYAIDHSIKKPDLSLLWQISLIYLFLSALKSILRFLSAYMSEMAANDLTYSLQKKVIRFIQRLPLSYFERNHSGSLITKLVVDTNRVSLIFSESIQVIFLSGIEIISIFSALLWISYKLTFFTFILSPILYFFLIWINRLVNKRFLESKKILSKLNFFTLESLNGMNLFKSFNYLKQRKFKFFEMSGKLLRRQMKLVYSFAYLWPLFNLFSGITLGLSLFLSYVFFHEWSLSIGQITAYILLLESFFTPLERALDKNLHLQDSFSSVTRLQEILKESPEAESGPKIVKNFKGKIRFENVFFKYPHAKDWILKDISFEIKEKQKVALIGKTGSGKTTLVELLQKFYHPQKGKIFIDDIPIEEIKTENLRENIGYIQQDVFLFQGSLLENISLHNESKKDFFTKMQGSQKELMKQILSKTKRLHHLVEEKGDNLSKGEKQILEVIRFFIYNPSVAIIDEGMSYLDHQTADEIKKILYAFSKDKTLLEITHKMEDFKKFDQILLMDEGSIIEKGSHQELLKEKKKYFQMFHQMPHLIDKV